MVGPIAATKSDKPNKITADEEDPEGDKERSPEMIHLLPPSAREERPIGESAGQNLVGDVLLPIGATKSDKPNKGTAGEEYLGGDREGTHKSIHLLPSNVQEERTIGASAEHIPPRDQLWTIGATKPDKPNRSTADEEDSEGDKEIT